VRERINLGHVTAGFLFVLRVNIAQTGQRVLSVDVHRARPADPLATGTTEGQGGVLVRFDFDQGVEDHGTAVVEIYGVGREVRLLTMVGIPSIDFEVFDAFLLCRRRTCQRTAHFQ